MSKREKINSLLFISLMTVPMTGLGVSSVNALSVISDTNSSSLVNKIIGSGITVTNSSFVGVSNSAGTFSGGSSSIGIEKGIILTTGNVNLAPGPNNSTNAGQNNSFAGDGQLSALIGGAPTFDATSLSFDFTSNTGNVFFKFAFASEEYNEYVGSQFNDVFGFFLNGQNIALIPNTTIPISINNVNNNLNSSFYTDNTNGAFNIQYDGFTKVLTASGNVGTVTNNIKLAIADTGDHVLDSAVFIEAGTFSSTDPEPVPEPVTILGSFVALGLGGIFKKKYEKRA